MSWSFVCFYFGVGTGIVICDAIHQFDELSNRPAWMRVVMIVGLVLTWPLFTMDAFKKRILNRVRSSK